MIVIADTSPLNYFVLIGHVDILSKLFTEVIVTPAVLHELTRPAAPQVVRQWISSQATWLVSRSPQRVEAAIPLGAGESEVISLAQELQADLVLMDDRRARREATSRGLAVAGTLNLLESAAKRDLVDLPSAIAKLQATNFRISERIIQSALAADVDRKRGRQNP